MAGLSVTQIKDTVDGIFPLKTFCLSLALLIIALFATIGIYQIFIAEPVEDITPTGKVMAMLELPKKIEDQPIQTIVEEPKEATPPTEGETAHPLTAADLPEATEPEPTEIVIEDSIAGLTEKTPDGFLPIVRASDGLKSFDAYKAPFKLNPETKGVISLVMVDYGLSDKLAKHALETLPAATNFVASSYSNNLQAKLSAARAKGMEVWMGIPMQGTASNDTNINMGPNTILSGLNTKENVARLNAHLGKATGYAGIAFDVKPSFEEASPDLKSLLNTASLRGLGIAQLYPKDPVISIAATQTNAPYINGDLWIDGRLTKTDITNALSAIEKISLDNGHAVAVFHPSMLTTSIISEWQKSLAAKHIQLAPLTYSIHISENAPDKKEPAPVEKAEKTEEKSNAPKH